jgi:uncharacterized phage protein (TIGR02218 family)
MKVNGSPILFNQNFPKNVYQPTCLHTVYDSGCGLNPASFTFSSTADVTSDAVLINFTGHVPPTSVANLQNGLCTFTSGALAGLRRTIRYVNTTDNNFAVAKPFPQAPAAGDAFTVTWGCQRSKDYCNNVMNNLTNFRGTPYVPIAEVSY